MQVSVLFLVQSSILGRPNEDFRPHAARRDAVRFGESVCQLELGRECQLEAASPSDSNWPGPDGHERLLRGSEARQSSAHASDSLRELRPAAQGRKGEFAAFGCSHSAGGVGARSTCRPTARRPVRASSFRVDRSLASATTGRRLYAAADIHSPNPNGCRQSEAVVRQANAMDC